MDKKAHARHSNRPKYPQQLVHGAPIEQRGPVSINHGHDGVLQYITFSRSCDHIALNEGQVDDFIRCMLEVKGKLATHKAGGGPTVVPGPDQAS